MHLLISIGHLHRHQRRVEMSAARPRGHRRIDRTRLPTDHLEGRPAGDGDTMNGELTLETLSPAGAGDEQLVVAVTDLVNEVYAVAEKGLWREDAARTTSDEMAGLIRAG